MRKEELVMVEVMKRVEKVEREVIVEVMKRVEKVEGMEREKKRKKCIYEMENH